MTTTNHLDGAGVPAAEPGHWLNTDALGRTRSLKPSLMPLTPAEYPRKHLRHKTASKSKLNLRKNRDTINSHGSRSRRTRKIYYP